MSIRKAAVAGYFYPDDPEILEKMVREFEDNSKIENYTPKAIVVPHAGYIYSGPVAASAYILLKNISDKISRVVLIGPSHHVLVRGVALSSADFFETPLGKLEQDIKLRDELVNHQGISINDDAHLEEHSLEVQLPFLQMILNRRIKILPAVTNMATPQQISHFLDLIWGSDETLIVVSSDLSHYLSYKDAVKKDRHTADAILSLDPNQIGDDDACGSVAVKGLMVSAKQKGLKPLLLDLRNSGDTGTEKTRVVGYGAFCFI